MEDLPIMSQNLAMSTIRNPQQKKLASLKKDRRNVYGECPTSSRKNIALGKQRSHQQARQAISEVLLSQRGPSDVLDEEVDSMMKERTIISKRKSFKKWPDAPLADVLYRRKTGEVTEFTGNKVKSKTLAALQKKS
jgi:hypothetical protein